MANKNEEFSNTLLRLFPDEHDKQAIKIGGNFTRSITFQVTEACNMRCTYCYQHDKTPQAMTFDIGKRFIDLVLEHPDKCRGYINSRKCPGVILDFIGGEPLLEIDLIDQLTDYFLERCIALNHPWATRYRINIGTNGLLYFNEKVQKYIHKHLGNISIAITVDGNKELHDMCRLDVEGNPTYDRAIAAADAWRVLGGGNLMSSKITFSPDNIKIASKAIIDLLEHGYNVINCNCVYEEGWTTEHAKILYNELKSIANYLLDGHTDKYVSILDWLAGKKYYDNNSAWCGGNGLMICVSPDGNIYPCLRYAPSSVGHRDDLITIGNVYDGFLATEKEVQTIECMKCITRRSQTAGTDCENCPIGSGCGDCAAYSWEVTGKLGSRVTYICDMHKARVLAQVYYRNLKKLKFGIGEGLPMNCPKEWAIPIIGEDEYNFLSLLAAKDGEKENGDSNSSETDSIESKDQGGMST